MNIEVRKVAGIGVNHEVDSNVGKIPTMASVDFSGKRVKVRADLDVDLGIDKETKQVDQNQIEDAVFRLVCMKNTIDYAYMHGALSVEVFGHIGRPYGQYVQELDTRYLVPILENILGRNVVHSDGMIKWQKLEKGEILLKQNTRFDPREEANDDTFAEELARDGDIFVDDAFAVSHRVNSSNVAIVKFFKESVCGLQLEKELVDINWLKSRPKKGSLAIVGGAKYDTKLPMIEKLDAERVCLTGLLSGEFIKTGHKVPAHFVLTENDDNGTDMNMKSMRDVTDLITEPAETKTIFWNGPAGLASKPKRAVPELGTITIARDLTYVTTHPKEFPDVLTYVGGGDTVTCVSRKGLLLPGSYTVVSTGGGAGQDYLAGEESEALKALRK